MKGFFKKGYRYYKNVMISAETINLAKKIKDSDLVRFRSNAQVIDLAVREFAKTELK